MNGNTNMQDIIDEAIESCVQFFRNNRSYIQLDEIQKSRCNINLLSVDVTTLKDNVELKHMVYDDIYRSVYITLPIKYITTGERIHPREMKRMRYNMIKMIDTIDILENMADVFVNGNKLPIKDISIAIFDDYFVLQVPFNCKFADTIDVLIRPTLIEKYASTSSIIVYKSELINKDINAFLAYVDGALTEKISVLEYDTYYTYMYNGNVASNFELCFIRNLVKYGNINNINSNFIRLNKNINKFPISDKHILPFRLSDGGKLHNLNMEAVTSNVFRCSEVVNVDYDIYYVYEERVTDDNNYHDNYKWYVDNILKGLNLNNLGNPASLPEFMNAFRLFDKEISLRNYVAEAELNLNTYNYKKLSQSIVYDQELMILYMKIIRDAMDVFVLKNSDFIKADSVFMTNNTRTSNKNEIIDVSLQTDFPSSMLLIAVPNYNNCHINVYIDGLRNHFYSWEGSELGITYIYIMRNRVSEGSVIEIEKFKFGRNNDVSMNIVGNGTDKINISNAKISGLISDNGTYNIVISDNYYIDEPIIDMVYDKINDILTITTRNILTNGNAYILRNLNYVKILKYETRHKGDQLIIDIESMNNPNTDKQYYRVYKNGRELPRESFNISTGGVNIVLDVKYTIYELIEIEFSPIKYVEMYNVDVLPDTNNGELDLYAKSLTTQIPQYFSNGICQYVNINGRKLDSEHYKYWCSQGATLHDIKSRKWCRIITESYTELDTVMYTLVDTFKKANHLFDKYMVTRMIGGPVVDTESDCTDENIERVGELYYDLYREFLKNNILDIKTGMPDYIAIKYSGLVDDTQNNSIMLDAKDKQLYWMPLDASMQSETGLINILDLYYKLLDQMGSIQVVDPDNIPPDIYATYKDLFVNNVLVLQIPDVPPM